MKIKHIFIFFISIFFAFGESYAQQDTLYYKERYGVTLGYDVGKNIRGLLDDNYTSYGVVGDFRLTEKVWLASELGYDEYIFDEANMLVETNGGYLKVGANYNFFENWIGMENLIYGGVRYGFATFSHELVSYTPTVRQLTFPPNDTPREQFFPPQMNEVNRSFSNLTAGWAEFLFGFRVEMVRNLFMDFNFQLMIRLNESELTNFAHMNIPGFGRTYQDSRVGSGFSYSIRYLIPLYTKTKKQAIDN